MEATLGILGKESPLLTDLARAYRLGHGSRWRRIAECVRAPGVHAVVVFRFGQWILQNAGLARVVLDPIYHVLQLLVQAAWGIEISRRASIGPGLYIGHFGSIIVAPGTFIGVNCSLSQDVTIGVSGRGPGRGVPRIGDYVYVAPGARVFGRIRVGNHVKIGANAVVHRDIPDNAVVVLDPGFRILSFDGHRAEYED
ncbi:MAG TPA: serine acetyltransferase [Burkholderiales bacterium]|nr:serine acetyltransferase [Burkholderiales bacterium]